MLHSAKAGLAGRLALRGRRRTVYVPHAWSFEAVQGAVGRASTVWEAAASRWTDMVVCVSEDERRRGREAGVFRADVDALDVHQVISAYCVFRTANRHTFGAIFHRDLLDPAHRDHQRRMLADLVVAWLTAR